MTISSILHPPSPRRLHSVSVSVICYCMMDVEVRGWPWAFSTEVDSPAKPWDVNLFSWPAFSGESLVFQSSTEKCAGFTGGLQSLPIVRWVSGILLHLLSHLLSTNLTTLVPCISDISAFLCISGWPQTCYLAKESLEHLILVPLPLKCCAHRCAPSHLGAAGDQSNPGPCAY